MPMTTKILLRVPWGRLARPPTRTVVVVMGMPLQQSPPIDAKNSSFPWDNAIPDQSVDGTFRWYHPTYESRAKNERRVRPPLTTTTTTTTPVWNETNSRQPKSYDGVPRQPWDRQIPCQFDNEDSWWFLHLDLESRKRISSQRHLPRLGTTCGSQQYQVLGIRSCERHQQQQQQQEKRRKPQVSPTRRPRAYS